MESMVVLYITLIILVCLLVLLSVDRVRFFIGTRLPRCFQGVGLPRSGGGRRGKLPEKGKATMFDVRHLLMEGEKELAIQLYCEIFHTIPTKAKKDIEELERSLKV